HTEDRYREQQGYRGRYSVVNGVAEVALAIDNTVCPHIFEGTLTLPRAASLKLRCVLATPADTNPIAHPVLLCQSTDGKPEELTPHFVEQIIPPNWFALGSSKGLRIWVTGRPKGAQAGDKVKVTAKEAEAPLAPNAWERAF